MAEFVDRAQLHARAGDGGAGAISFRREAHVDKGGPDGGDGGDGGSIWLRASSNLSSLIGFRDQPFRRAPNGAHGQGKKKRGVNGRDLVIEVPAGTVVKDLDGATIADLASVGMKVRVGRGGRGGKGNAGFLSNRRRAPSFAEQGEPGEDLWFNLELKLVADVALVGFPNVGKSSLISVISRAKPKIANYPFTTLVPSLGVARMGGAEDVTEFVVADVPGLIEGASSGRGLGHEFLRHIERARVIALILDPTESTDLTLEEQSEILLDEMASHLPELADRPTVVVVNKCDEADDRDGLERRAKELADEIGALDVTVVSAVTREHLDELTHSFARALHEATLLAEEEIGEDVVVHRFEEEPAFEITREPSGTYVVEGRDVLRAVRLSDLGSLDAMLIIHRRLERLGVLRALRRAGITEGDEVVIGDLSFEYEDTITQ
ncbi:MAG: GTPase ObgE [Acidimicrobiales bacterium]